MSEKRKRLSRKSCNSEQLRCWNALSWVVRGDHHFDGPVYECGENGIRSTLYAHANMATFDGDVLTRLVLVAHMDRVRVVVSSGGPRRIGVQIYPRKESGDMWERHPSLTDLAAKAIELHEANEKRGKS